MLNRSSVPRDEAEMAELWNRFKNGEEKAFDELTQRRYRNLFNYALRFTDDRELVKDCIQDLFLELWNRREFIVDTPYVTIYLIKSLRNNLFRKLKQIGKKVYVRADEQSLGAFTDGQTIELEWITSELCVENEQNLKKAIQALPQRQQEVIFLKFYQGFSNDNIAHIMNVESQTVSNFLYRALTQLRKIMPQLVCYVVSCLPLLRLTVFSD